MVVFVNFKENQIVPAHASTPIDRFSSSAPNSAALVVSRSSFRVVWVFVVLVSLLNALLAFAFAAMYTAALMIQDGYMIQSSGLLPPPNIPFVIAAYVFVVVYFLRLVWRVIYPSIRRRQLVFVAGPRQIPTPHNKKTTWAFIGVFRERRSSLKRLIAKLKSSIPEMFDLVFLFREIVEIITQTYQVYKCSTLIAQTWINQFYVAVLAINCWIAPLIHVYFHRHPMMRRFCFLSSDILLDFTSTLIVPMFIIQSAVLIAFENNTSSEYAFDAPYGDTFLVNMFKGVQQICVVSWWDFVSKMLPFLSMASCLNIIKGMVVTPGSIQFSTPTVVVVSAFRSRQRSGSISDSETSQFVNLVCAFLQSRLMRFLLSVHVIYLIFFIWGITIVAFHTAAVHVSNTAPLEATVGCKSSSMPWFVSTYSCAVMEISCIQRGFTGSAAEITHALSLVNSLGTSSLIISHCPSLHMPEQLHRLQNLIGLEVSDSTIVSWDEDAALDKAHLPSLLYFTLTRVNMTELPRGVQSSNFPPRLTDIAISVSNLTALPDDLYLKWPNVASLYVERTLLDRVPPCLPRMSLFRLSIMDNRIQSLPADLFANGMSVLSVAKNPIAQLPDSGSIRELRKLLVDYTDVTTLPPWVLAEGERRVAAREPALTVSTGGTPYCNAARSSSPQTRRADRGVPALLQRGAAHAHCAFGHVTGRDRPRRLTALVTGSRSMRGR